MKRFDVVAVVLLMLAAIPRSGSLPASARTIESIAELREVLLRDTWAHEVRIGRVAVERRVLAFDEDGTVKEWVYDDTGRHESHGTWVIELAGGVVVLTLDGQGLRDKGRYAVRRVAGDEAIELRFEGGERVLRFERRKG